MILFRALNIKDIENLTEKGNVYCSLYNHRVSLKNKKKFSRSDENCYIDFIACFGDKEEKGKVANSLDTIIGHIEGSRLKYNNSPWISTSTDLDYVITEYAIPQSGNYNAFSNRKPIAVINYDDSIIYDTPEKLSLIRDRDYGFNYAVDLRNGKLNDYVSSGVIKPASCNKDLSSYNVIYDINSDYNPIRVNGFAGYATTAKEVLINGSFSKDDITLMLSPFMQDIIYGCRYKLCNIDEAKKLCDNINTLYDDIKNPFIKELYPSVDKGNNLTDYLVDNYDSISGNDIKEKYRNLKQQKIIILSDTVTKLNMKLDRLVDDGIRVINYYDSPSIYKSYIHDIVLVERNGIIFKSNPGKGNFYAYQDDKKIVLKVTK